MNILGASFTRSPRLTAMSLIAVLTAVVVTMTVGAGVRAADAKDGDGKSSTNTERTYDIRDLVVAIPDFSAPQLGIVAPPSKEKEKGQAASAGSLTRDQAVREILESIRQVGRPDEWAAHGGDVSSVNELDGKVLVRTSPQNHRDIHGLLTMLREVRALQINVEVRFLLADEDLLEEIGLDLGGLQESDDPDDTWSPLKIAQDHFTVAGRQNTGLDVSFGAAVGNTGLDEDDLAGMTVTSFSYLSDLQVSVLIRASQQHRHSMVSTMPRLTFFNGQRAYISQVKQVAYVRSYDPVPGGDGFEPQLGIIETGVILEVTGTVSDDRRYVTLTVEPQVATIVNIRKEPFEGGPPGSFVEVPEVETWKTSLTVSVPDRGTLLIGGDKVNHLLLPGGKAFDGLRVVLLLVKPTIIAQTDGGEIKNRE